MVPPCLNYCGVQTVCTADKTSRPVPCCQYIVVSSPHHPCRLPSNVREQCYTICKGEGLFHTVMLLPKFYCGLYACMQFVDAIGE